MMSSIFWLPEILFLFLKNIKHINRKIKQLTKKEKGVNNNLIINWDIPNDIHHTSIRNLLP
jgi:hypothetical protein